MPNSQTAVHSITRILLAMLAGCAFSIGQQRATDYQIEAAYLYNFAKLGEWPKQILADGVPLSIGVVGGDENFVEVLKKSVAEKTAGNHPIVVRHLTLGDDLKTCHLLFFRASERKHIQEAIANSASEGILLIGEDKEFLEQGGTINLALENGAIHFELAPDALERSGIRFGAEVLSRATIQHSVQSPSVVSRKLEQRIPPKYPQLAYQMNLTGTVQVEAIVGRDGAVKKVKLIGGHPVLAQAALDAVMKWKYEPAAEETVEVVKLSFDNTGVK